MAEEESEHERLNRNLDQLLQELRVALPGVQVLFAFLLTVPFASRWRAVDEVDRLTYFVALALAALATALLIAPTIHHRILFQQEDKRHLVVAGNALAIAGLACLALAVNAAVFLVGRVLFGTLPAICMLAAGLVVYGGLWFAWPASRRRSHRRSNLDGASPDAERPDDERRAQVH
jgi:MFS family permease